MPSLVISYVRPWLPYLCDKTLWCIQRDIEEASARTPEYEALGDPMIDAPLWVEFLGEVKAEMARRTSRK